MVAPCDPSDSLHNGCGYFALLCGALICYLQSGISRGRHAGHILHRLAVGVCYAPSVAVDTYLGLIVAALFAFTVEDTLIERTELAPGLAVEDASAVVDDTVAALEGTQVGYGKDVQCLCFVGCIGADHYLGRGTPTAKGIGVAHGSAVGHVPGPLVSR